MKTNTGNTPEQQPAEPEAAHAEPPAEPEGTKGELTPEDRAKLSEVVRKERAAARVAKAAAEKAEARLAELEAAELRRTVAEDKGLTPEQAAFLSGDSAEEMAASADALLAAFGGGRSHRVFGTPVEATLRTGATGARLPAESAAALADKVLD